MGTQHGVCFSSRPTLSPTFSLLLSLDHPDLGPDLPMSPCSSGPAPSKGCASMQCMLVSPSCTGNRAPKVKSTELNHDEADGDLKELQKIIRDVNSQGYTAKSSDAAESQIVRVCSQH
ncbi:Protein PTHB1 [Fukomys damarensis]|uniref:Protein PTHB1 n=1 Tax=Fukomys damarensis TaxID=885580 RepID=A0A091DAQ0_FUKDA|nr:Protein PTHB1 [Fukomys damarensis]